MGESNADQALLREVPPIETLVCERDTVHVMVSGQLPAVTPRTVGPTQPVEHVPPIDVSKLSTEEPRTLDTLLSRVVIADGSGRSSGAG